MSLHSISSFDGKQEENKPQGMLAKFPDDVLILDEADSILIDELATDDHHRPSRQIDPTKRGYRWSVLRRKDSNIRKTICVPEVPARRMTKGRKGFQQRCRQPWQI